MPTHPTSPGGRAHDRRRAIDAPWSERSSRRPSAACATPTATHTAAPPTAHPAALAPAPRIALLLLTIAALLAPARAAVAQVRVVTWNVAQLNGDVGRVGDVFEFLMDDDRPGFAVAPHVVILQEVQSSDVATLTSLLNTAAPPGVSYALATYTNSGEDGVGGAQALYYRPDTISEIPAGHVDIFTGAGRRADRWQLRLDDASVDAGTFWVYGMHLKASPGGANEAQRLAGAQAVRGNAENTLPAGALIIYAGDLNLYDNGEPAYTEFITGGPNAATDPLGTGPWNGVGNAIKHTQSPRATAEGFLVGGGMDDRFDFILPSSDFADQEGFALIPGTYRALGNDGLHFDDSINDGNNFYYADDVPTSNALADALFDASDHLPVVLDFQVPGALTVDGPASLGRVILNALVSAEVTVANTASALVPEGADEVFATWSTSGDVFGGGSVLLQPLTPPQTLPAFLDTSVAGNANGTIDVVTADQGVADPVWSIDTIATVLRPTNASLDPVEPVTDGVFTATVDADTGLVPLALPIYNLGWDPIQSRLDVDAIDGLDATLQATGTLPQEATSIAVVTLSFDTDGRAPGVYETTLAIDTSDEDVPGETTAVLSVDVAITVVGDGSPFDLDGDGSVGFGDLVALLAAWGDCPDGGPCPADFDDNGTVDFSDLVALLAAWS